MGSTNTSKMRCLKLSLLVEVTLTLLQKDKFMWECIKDLAEIAASVGVAVYSKSDG